MPRSLPRIQWELCSAVHNALHLLAYVPAI